MAGESQAVLTARQFRKQLVRQEDAALREMARHWVRMEKDLEAQYMALYAEVKDMMQNGETVPPQMIYNLQRYGDMMAQIMQEIPEYDSDAVKIMTDYQIDSYNLGLEAARATIMGTSPADSIWNVVGKDAAEAAAGFAGNGAPLGALLQHDYGDLGAKVIDSLVSGIALGKGAFETAKDMRDVMGMEYKRSVRIARTEINRAYRIAAADQYAKSGVVEKVLRLCAKTPETCLACLEMDGEECPNGIVDDHPNGRCTSVVVTTGGIYPQWQHGHDWLMEQDEDTQRAIMGDGRFEMWKQDGIPLRDMVKMEPNPVWGGNPALISERELRQRYNLSGGNKTLFDVKPAPAPEPPKPIIPDFTPAKTRQEAEEFARKFARNVEYSRISLDNCNAINKKLNELTSKYPIKELSNIGKPTNGQAIMRANFNGISINRKLIGGTRLEEEQKQFEALQESRRARIERMKSRYNNAIPKDIQRQIDILEKQLQYSRWSVFDIADQIGVTVTHEYGHIIADQYFGQINGSKANPNFDKNYELRGYIKKWEDVFKKAKSSGDVYKLSEYGATNAYEFFAESFAAKELGEKLPDYVSDLMEEILRNGIM